MLKRLLILAAFLAFVAFDLNARSLVSETPPVINDFPEAQQRVHRVGNVYFCNTNWGILGSWTRDVYESLNGCFSPYPDSEIFAPSFEKPSNSGIEYLFLGALWVGAILTTDTEIETLVTVGADGWWWMYEMAPGMGSEYGIIEKSTIPEAPCYSLEALSAQDIIGIFSDTADAPLSPWDISTDWDGRPHHPLGIEITQIGYSWSLPEYDNFIILSYQIKNIGTYNLLEVYLGYYMDTDIWHISENPYRPDQGAQDDLTGFLKDYVDLSGETTEVNIAWAADNDGQPYSGMFTDISPTGVIGIKLLESSNPDPKISYNWWNSNGQGYPKDWGPWLKDNQQRWAQINPYTAGPLERFPDNCMGTPGGDRSKYFLMSNGEIDYDQIFIDSIPQVDTSWIPAHPWEVIDFIMGRDIKFLYSFGPFNLAPGDTIFAAVALIAGENFHTDPENRDINLPDYPYTYYSNLDFSDLVEKAILAQEFYDAGLDLIPPASIRNLRAGSKEIGSIILSWVATGDNGNLGLASYYDLRYSASPVGTDTGSWWEHAYIATNLPVPSEPGSVDSFRVSGLSPDSVYYFIIRVYDDVGYCSDFSNIAYSGMPGDVDLNGKVDIDDILIVIQYALKSGYLELPMAAADVNGDCVVDIEDVIYLVNYLYERGAAPKIGCA